MVLLLTFVLGLLQVSSPSPVEGDTLPIMQSKQQARQYMWAIDSGNAPDAHLWALSVLANAHPEIRSFIERQSQNERYNSREISLFREVAPSLTGQLKNIVFETGSRDLLVALLLSQGSKDDKEALYKQFTAQFSTSGPADIDYESLYRAIINEEPVEWGYCPPNRFFLPHFFLLYDRAYKSFFSKKYLTKLAENWQNTGSQANLYSMLATTSHFRVLYLLDQYAQMQPLYHQLINNGSLFPNSPLKLRIYRYLDYSMYRLGYYDRSLEIVRNFTEPLAKRYGSEEILISVKISKGTSLFYIGKIKEAQNVFEQTIAEANKKNIPIPKTIIYNNLALTYHKLGKYDQFLDLQFQALETAKESNNYSHQLEILNNLSIFYRKFGNSNKALNYLQEAQQIAKEKGDKNDLISIYTSLGAFYRTFEKDFTKAYEYFEKAENILSTETNSEYYIHLLNEKAEAFETQKKYAKAIKQHNRIIEFTKHESGRNLIDALINKALIKLKTNSDKEAGKLIKEYKSHDLSQLDFPQLIKAKTVEANYLQRIGNLRKALDILQPALDQVLVRTQSSANLKSGFWHIEDEYLDAFERAASIYMDIGEPEKAVEKLDQLKTINDASLYQNPLVKSSLLNESELTEYKQLTNQLDVIRKKLLTAPEEKQFEIRQQISKLNTKKRKYDRRLTRNAESDPASIRRIQNKLSAREMILHITELNEQFYVAQISRSDVTIHTIKLDDNLEQLLTSSAHQIATNNANLDALYQISRILQLQDIPDYVEKITIIPDSYFYQLPLDVLPLEKPSESYSYGEPTYVIERFETQYLTTLEDFKSPDRRTKKSNNPINYVGFGVSNFDGYHNQSLVPLPYAQSEVTAIADKLTHLSNIRTYINEQSTKSVFKQTAPSSRIIHLATHSSVSTRDPMFSTIYLSRSTPSPDSTFEDQIFAYELFELNLNNEMIMLNSCDSGSGSYIQGTGVMGISRALRYAGANSLVLNLWSVNDMLAADFAIYFYSRLNEGKSKAQALRATKLYFLNHKNANPHFWGPYMLIGDIEPIVDPYQNKNMAMAGIFLFYFLLMITLS